MSGKEKGFYFLTNLIGSRATGFFHNADKTLSILIVLMLTPGPFLSLSLNSVTQGL